MPYDIYGKHFSSSRATVAVFYASATYNAVGTADIQAAPGAGLSIYLTDVIVTSLGSGSTSIKEDSVLAGTYILSDLSPAAGVISVGFKTPVRLGENVPLTVESRTVVDHSVTVAGYITATH